MKLAEALSLRSDAQKRLAQLRSRAEASARYQEGEEPPEDAQQLLSSAEDVAAELETLIRAINRTNAATEIEPGLTITDAIAQRDILKERHSLLSSVANAASGKGQASTGYRQIRSELRYVSAVSVADLRNKADQIAQEHRKLDTRIQEKNWEVELID